MDMTGDDRIVNLKSDLEYKALIKRIQTLMASKRYRDARTGLEQILRKRKNDPHAMWLMASLNWSDQRFDDAFSLLKRYIKLHPRDAKAPILLGDYLARRGRFQEAISTLKRVQRQHPDNTNVIFALASAYELQGEIELAIETLTPMLESGAHHADAAVLQANLLVLRKDELGALKLIDQLLQQKEELSPSKQKKLWFLRGKAYENLDDAAESYESYANANRFDEGRFDEDKSNARIDRVCEIFNPEAMKTFPRSTIESSRPVFVVSRPRSGSTLVERIIGAHREAHAAGEIEVMDEMASQLMLKINSTLPFPECVSDLEQEDVDACAREYLETLATFKHDAKRITDKSLGNHKLLGLIALLFPGARVIDLRRNPIDTCLACWTVDLSKNFPGSSRLEDLALEYRQHIHIMEHWHRVLELPILRVNYEDLVTQQETWSRTIIDFLDLPWDEQCLKFHESGSKRTPRTTPAPTLSYHQVTKPIYTSSVNRADKFSQYLTPVRAILDLGEDSPPPLGHDLRY